MTQPTPPWLTPHKDGDVRRHAPATLRNRGAIIAVLQDILPSKGLILEIASGSGEHITHFSKNYPDLIWQPSDPDVDALRSIAAWCADRRNVRPPIMLDASESIWPIEAADAILCINMIHISPWAATTGLFQGAARCLPPGAPLYLYGPYRRAGVETAPSNEAFDQSLKARNPAWGLRDADIVKALAQANSFALKALIEMPANNISLIFQKIG